MATTKKQLNSNGANPVTYCVDLNGYTFTGETRAFYLYDGTVVNLFDSVGGGVLEGYGSAATWGSTVYVETGADFHMYGGTLRHNAAKTDTVTNGGAICALGGDVVINGGTVEGSSVSGSGGTIYISSSSRGSDC